MKPPGSLTLLFFALVAAGSVMRLSDWGTKHGVDDGSIRRWMDEGADEVRRRAVPVPGMLFSMRPSACVTDSSQLMWLEVEELRPFQQCLNLNSQLLELSNQMAVLDPAYWQLVTTDGLIIDITNRPKDPIPPLHRIIGRNYSDKPRWESFWLKTLPPPVFLSPTAFTPEQTSENGSLLWKASWNLSWDLMQS